MAKNVLGTDLEPCSFEPMTGFLRTGYCQMARGDEGLHCVCAVMTDAFLAYSASRGNDLTIAIPDVGFPGLEAGDRWCLCIDRWKEAHAEGVAPPVVLEATHISTLEFVEMEDLRRHAAHTHSD